MARYQRRRRYGRRPIRRRNFRRRRSTRFGRRRSGSGRYSANRVYSFKRKVIPLTLQSNVNLETDVAFKFALSDLVGYQDFTGLFDSYKIVGVKLLFLPRADQQPSAAGNAGVIWYAPDYDDNNATTLQALQQYQTVKMVRGDKPFSCYVRPKNAVPIYQTGSTYGYGQGTPWIDSINSSLPYYGFKLVWTQTSVIYTYDVYYTYYIRCKQVL